MRLIGYTFLLLVADEGPTGPFDALPSTVYPNAGTATDALVIELATYVATDRANETVKATDTADAWHAFQDNVSEPAEDPQGNPVWDCDDIDVDDVSYAARIYPMYMKD